MTETFGVAGRNVLSEVGGVPGSVVAAGAGVGAEAGTGEADLVDRLIDLVLALEPLELKQDCTGDGSEVEPVASGRERGGIDAAGREHPAHAGADARRA